MGAHAPWWRIGPFRWLGQCSLVYGTCDPGHTVTRTRSLLYPRHTPFVRSSV